MLSSYLNNAVGTLIAADDGSLVQAERGINNAYGHLQGSRNLTIKANKFDNQGGRLLALGGDAQLETQLVIINTGGRIEAKNRLSPRSQHLMNANGVLAGQEVTIDTRRKPLGNTGGSVLAQATLRISCGLLENNSGRLQAGTLLSINTGALDNSAGRIITAGEARIKSRDFDNSGGYLQAGSDLNIDTQNQRLINTHSSPAGILCGGCLTLNACDIDNGKGLISAVGECRVNSGALLNAGGGLQSGDHLKLDTHGQQLNNAYSRNAGILSGGNLLL